MVKELEVKVLDVDIEIIEKRLKSLGAKLISKEIQINTLIDSNERPIKSYMDAYLRIRESRDLLNGGEDVTLTLKKNIKNKDLRENVELNTQIKDKDTMLQILKDLGFNNVSVGHKERTSYILEGARIDLDTWDKDTYSKPYIEIEVENTNQLNRIVELLEIDKKKISTKSIVELRRELNLE